MDFQRLIWTLSGKTKPRVGPLKYLIRPPLSKDSSKSSGSNWVVIDTACQLYKNTHPHVNSRDSLKIVHNIWQIQFLKVRFRLFKKKWQKISFLESFRVNSIVNLKVLQSLIQWRDFYLRKSMHKSQSFSKWDWRFKKKISGLKGSAASRAETFMPTIYNQTKTTLSSWKVNNLILAIVCPIYSILKSIRWWVISQECHLQDMSSVRIKLVLGPLPKLFKVIRRFLS